MHSCSHLTLFVVHRALYSFFVSRSFFIRQTKFNTLLSEHIFLHSAVRDYYRPQGEGNVFTGVCLYTIGLMAARSLLGLTARSVRILWNAFLLCLVTVFYCFWTQRLLFATSTVCEKELKISLNCYNKQKFGLYLFLTFHSLCLVTVNKSIDSKPNWKAK